MESIILLVVLLFLILLGAPIGFILILIPFVYILFTDAVPLVLIPSQMFNAIDSVPLTAIAFFMLTGELMTSATITDRLVALSRALIGRIRGGLAQVNVLVSMFFAGMNEWFSSSRYSYSGSTSFTSNEKSWISCCVFSCSYRS